MDLEGNAERFSGFADQPCAGPAPPIWCTYRVRLGVTPVG